MPEIPARANFTELDAPAAFFNRADHARRRIGDVFYVGSKTGHLREAWVIGKIAMLIGATSCRLTDTDPPDGVIQVSGTDIPVEVTTLLDPDRRWGDEFKPGGVAHADMQELTHADIERPIAQSAKWLDDRIQEKIAIDHRYPPGTVLAIYHNADLWNFHPERTKAELENAAQLRGKNIIGCLVLFDGAVYGEATLLKISIESESKP